MLFLFLQLAMAQVFPPAADPWVGVVGAPSGAVAAWTSSRVLWSARGEGFEPILVGADPIATVALDDDGSAWVARGMRLGVRTPDGVERWLALPGDGVATERLLVRKGRIVWLGRTEADGDATYMVSRDGGVTFAARPDWPVGNFTNEVSLDARGRVQIIAGSEASCGGGYQNRVAGALGDLELAEAPWDLDAPVDYVASPSGWAYVPDDACGDREGLCAVPPKSGASRPLAVDVGAVEGRPSMFGVGDDTRTWLVADGRLLVATGAKARVMSRALPRDASAIGVAAGRPWVLAAGGLHVLEGDHWRAVALR